MKIVIVNERDEIIGAKERGALIPGDIYRVSALWLTNPRGEVLLAQRAFTKDHNPGKWGPAAAGTVDDGESYDDNIKKEAAEELGLTGVDFQKAQKIRRTGRYDHFVQWYTASVDRPAEQFKIQASEVAAVRWVSRTDLAADLAARPEQYLPAMRQYLDIFP